MILDRVNKIKANVSIYSNKKTSNILDGTYNSIYKGKSMNFEDLREYVPGDSIRDIDWKASARNGSLLVKRFIAEKKHNIILVFDSSKKMLGDTNSGEAKKEIAMLSLGTIAYLANKNGDYVSGIYNKGESITLYPFKSTLYSIEQILSGYDQDIKNGTNNDNLEACLQHIVKYINRKAIIFIATDIYGVSKISEQSLKTLAVRNNILFVNVGDAELSGNTVFDVEDGSFVPKFLLNNKKLISMDREIKEKIAEDAKNKLKKYAIPMISIDNTSEIVPKIIELLEKHKNAKSS
ncbi:MAG: DUF58 domain-containing protein [Clostridia bacterium]|nr:DUF58 domain-containing protein [Clostridia bacterium]